MFAPTACTTPTRLPTLMWTLAAALLLLGVFAPAFAGTPRLADAGSELRATVAPDDGAQSQRGCNE